MVHIRPHRNGATGFKRAVVTGGADIARIFDTYGPRMRPDGGRAIPTFIRQALAGEPLTVTGNGSQARSICYVSDTDPATRRPDITRARDRLGWEPTIDFRAGLTATIAWFAHASVPAGAT